MEASLSQAFSPSISMIFGDRALPEKSVIDLASTSFTRAEITPGLDREQFEKFRLSHLNRLAKGDIPVVFLVSGASASGKSFVLRQLADIGISPSLRMISRPRREDDSSNDIGWENSSALLFSYCKYGDYYGFPSLPLEQSLAGRSDRHLSYIVGDAGKISPLYDAVQHAVPMLPVVSLRVDVPLDIAKERLSSKRSPAFDGEAQVRAVINTVIKRWEDWQLPVLKHAYGLSKILNITPEEHARHGYESSQLQPLTPEMLGNLTEGFISEARARAASQACDLLAPRSLDYELPGIPPSLVDVLENQLLPGAAERRIVPALKGGLAVATYLQSAWISRDSERVASDRTLFARDEVLKKIAPPVQVPYRAVSPDIDWTMLDDEQTIRSHQELISEVSGARGEFHDAFEKPVFHSKKINSETKSGDGTTVELDAIAVSRVQPNNEGFCFEFKYDEYLDFFRREVRLPSGGIAHLVPPEMLITEKLAAGRGSEGGKLDLPDVAGILATQPVNLSLIKHIVEMQAFDAQVDPVTGSLERPDLGDISPELRKLGIQDQRLMRQTLERLLAQHEFEQAASNQEVLEQLKQECDSQLLAVPLGWTPDNLKKLAFVDVLLRSLDKLQEEVLTTAGEDLDLESLNEKIEALREYFYYYASAQLGRPDVFVNRNNLMISGSFPGN